MTAPTLQALLDKAESLACGMLTDHGKILPCVICHKADRESFIIVYDPAPTVMQRRFVALEIGKKLRETNAAAYVVLHEVWIGDHPSRQAAEAALVKGPPSKSPERIDGALIEAHDIASTEALMFKIDRSGKKPNLVPLYNPADDPGNAVTDRSSPSTAATASAADGNAASLGRQRLNRLAGQAGLGDGSDSCLEYPDRIDYRKRGPVQSHW